MVLKDIVYFIILFGIMLFDILTSFYLLTIIKNKKTNLTYQEEKQIIRYKKEIFQKIFIWCVSFCFHYYITYYYYYIT